MSNEYLDAVYQIVDRARQMYPSRRERVAMRGALGDAATLCDAFASLIERQNPKRRGTGTQKEALLAAALVRRVGDAIQTMRDNITFDEDQPPATNTTASPQPHPNAIVGGGPPERDADGVFGEIGLRPATSTAPDEVLKRQTEPLPGRSVSQLPTTRLGAGRWHIKI